MLGSAARIPVIVGTMAATIVANLMGDRNIGSAVVFGACNAGEAVLVAALLDRIYGLPFNLDSLRRVMGLVCVAIIGPVVSGIGGTAGYLLFHNSTASALTIWWHWSVSDAIGIMTVAPLFIGLPPLITDPPPRRELLEGTLALTILTALSALVTQLPNDTWTGEIAIVTVFPLLLWIAARCRPVFAAAAVFVCAISIVWTTTFEIGIFGDPNLTINERVQASQASILAVSLCGLVLAALFAERRQHAHSLAESERRLQGALTEAERANRAKTSFLSAASHDLRQPLQSLNLLQSALKRRVEDGEGLILINRIGHSLGVMKGILDSLLDVNRVEVGTLAPAVSDFQIGDVFDSVTADFLELAKEKNLELRVVRSRAAVHSDRHMLEVMIRNLLSNAVRYTEHGRILLGCRRAEDKLRIEVWDSGIGIKAEHIPRIFEEYYQAEGGAHPDGYGLGLAIVDRLKKVLGHDIKVRSTLGKGSGFSIALPLARKKADTADQPAISASESPGPFRGTILVVEDDAFVRSGLESLLNSEQVNAVAAANANEALAMVARDGLRPDLILSDLNLHGSVDGIECIDAVRAALKRKIPAIVLTGDVRSQAYERIEKHNVGIALKPLNAEELMKLINRTVVQA
jgi:signal transduction histidine kinase/ActR/RegA family two-component response regulator